MTENPYDILGVSRDASLDEVKKAYRKQARENHPDLNPDDPAAADRMNKINEAYDRIVNPEKYTRADARERSNAGAAGGYGSPGAGSPGGYRSPGGYGSPNDGGGRQGSYDWAEVNWGDFFGGQNVQSEPIHPESSATDSAEIRQVIDLINAKNYAEAINILRSIPSTGRNARWYYLSALANNGAGNTVQAIDQIRRARQMDPDNRDYARAESSFTQRASTYEQESTNQGFSTGFISPTTICCCVCLASTMCPTFLRCGAFVQ